MKDKLNRMKKFICVWAAVAIVGAGTAKSVSAQDRESKVVISGL